MSMSCNNGHFWLCDVPGTDTFDVSGPLSLGALYDAMGADGLLEAFCYDGVPSRDAFIEKFNHDNHWTYAAFREDGVPLVMAVVNGVTGKSGLAHFCYFRAGLATRAGLAREWLLMLRDGGMQSLVGLTPAPFRHALRFAQDMGFRRAGVVPGACVLAARHNRVCDGVLTILDMTSQTGEALPPRTPPQGA